MFRNKSYSMGEVVQSIVWSLSEWVRNRTEFQGIDLNDLHRSWVVILNGGWHVKPVSRVCWMTPPMGILKLNFDGSFIHSIKRGGIGGVIRDWYGTVFMSFLGPLDSVDTNEVEVFALLF